MGLEQAGNEDEVATAEDDIERQVAKEMESMKRPRKEKLFSENVCLLSLSQA